MKGPSLPYDLRALRVFRCDACGRQIQVPARTTTWVCSCSDPARFMRPLERMKVVPPDVTRFLSPVDPEELAEAEAEAMAEEEPHVPFVPQLPPRPVQFPRRRKLSDEIEKFQLPEFGVGVEGTTGSDEQDVLAESRDKHQGVRGDVALRPKQDRRNSGGPDRSTARPPRDRPAPESSDDGQGARVKRDAETAPGRRQRHRRSRDGRSNDVSPLRETGTSHSKGDDFGSGIEPPGDGQNLSGGKGSIRLGDPDSGLSTGPEVQRSGDGSGPSRRGRRRSRRRGRGPAGDSGNASGSSPQAES